MRPTSQLVQAAAAVLFALLMPALAAAAPIRIVAAENFYGGVAVAVGGTHVTVTSFLKNPDQDPHLFEAKPSTAVALAKAAIVIENGIGYDPWMHDLLRASKRSERCVITVADLVGKKSGDNPHLWYLPQTMPALAKALAAELARRDPAHRTDYIANRDAFDASLAPLSREIQAMRAKYHGLAITATEPVFNYMATALGLVVRNRRFQLSVMNNTEPRASDIAAFEADLKMRRVRVLIYNRQTSSTLTRHLQRLARQSGIPIVGVSETEPPGTTYRDWMMGQLAALNKALAEAAR